MTNTGRWEHQDARWASFHTETTQSVLQHSPPPKSETAYPQPTQFRPFISPIRRSSPLSLQIPIPFTLIIIIIIYTNIHAVITLYSW